MHVHVHPVLAGGLADIDADVEAVRREAFCDVGMRLAEQLAPRRARWCSSERNPQHAAAAPR
jgi:hypothetical protein